MPVFNRKRQLTDSQFAIISVRDLGDSVPARRVYENDLAPNVCPRPYRPSFSDGLARRAAKPMGAMLANWLRLPDGHLEFVVARR